MKKAVVGYERIAGAKVSFNKSDGLRFGAWSDGPVRILGVWFRPDLQLERNWSEVQAKANARVGTWLPRRLPFKGKVEVCAVYTFPLIPLHRDRRLALQRSLTRFLWGGRRLMIRRQICIQLTSNGGLGMPDIESHWLAERLTYSGRFLSGDAVWRRRASRTFPRLQLDPKAESRRWSMGETPLVRECCKALRNLPGSSVLSPSRRELYPKIVVGSASDPLSERHS